MKNFYRIQYIFVLVLMGACASKPKIIEVPKAGVTLSPNKASTTPVKAPLPAPSPIVKSNAAAVLSATQVLLPKKVVELSSVPAEKALQWLKNGNTRYLKKNLRKDGQSAGDRERLSKGQHPHSIILSCSDSRVPPEIIFDQKLGEIFVIRTAGEALDSSVIASIEYALEHLGSRLLLVLGHESCGAVEATLGTAEGQSAGSPDLDKLVADIRPRLSVVKGPASKGYLVESFANATGVASDLVKRSAIIKKFVSQGDLTIKSAIYRLSSGEVVFN